MSELPVPVVTPPEAPQPRIAAEALEDLKPRSHVCANCHAPLSGEYCASCGQRHEPHIHTVAHFAGEAFESISHADSRLWRTLWYLFARPGFLTREFFAGRRVAYLPPFRLYLVLSVLFFVVIGLGGEGPSVQIEKPRTAEDVKTMNELADQFEKGNFAPMTDEARQRTAERLRAIAKEQAAQIGQKEADAAATTAAERKRAEAGAKPGAKSMGDIDVMTGEGVQSGIEDFCDGFRLSISSDSNEESSAKQQSVLRWCRKYGDEGFSAVGETLAHNIPKAMFVFLPLLALCMKLIYWRPKRYYVEHLLFMVHNHAFVFLVMAAVMLIGMIPFVGDYAWPLYWAAFIYIAWYIFRAMRNVYGQGRALTLLKYLTMGYVYILAGATIFLLTFIYSTITF
jgi:hypothetical protein